MQTQNENDYNKKFTYLNNQGIFMMALKFKTHKVTLNIVLPMRVVGAILQITIANSVRDTYHTKRSF